MRIGILCPSEIAFRRFLPSLKKYPGLVYAGVAVADSGEWYGGSPGNEVISSEREKAEKFKKLYDGEVFASYSDMLKSGIECIYIPLPPALHYSWAREALENGKHVLLEKPFTTSLNDTMELLRLAKVKSLAVHENYMFQYHSQINFIVNELKKGTIGEFRLARIDFGFPFRGTNDFRYNRNLGGGALLDCGGYVIKLASIILGETAKIAYAGLNLKDGFEVDIYGSAVMTSNMGTTVQISFGMDNDYRCSLDVWGSKGSLRTDRVLTAPDGFEPVLQIQNADGASEIKLESDDSFLKSIAFFNACIQNQSDREKNYADILKQAELIDKFKEMAK